MSIVELIFVLVIIGVGLYLLNTLPIAQPIKTIIYVVVVLLVLLWLLELFGLMNLGGPVGRHRYWHESKLEQPQRREHLLNAGYGEGLPAGVD